MSKQKFKVLSGPHHVKTMRCCGIPADHAEILHGKIGVQSKDGNLGSWIRLRFSSKSTGLPLSATYSIPRTCLEAL